jgi:hypothetical protein
VFKSVGQVVGFRYIRPCFFSLSCLLLLRLVFDRETGKPRGYGFCEFAGVPHLSRHFRLPRLRVVMVFVP